VISIITIKASIRRITITIVIIIRRRRRIVIRRRRRRNPNLGMISACMHMHTFTHFATLVDRIAIGSGCRGKASKSRATTLVEGRKKEKREKKCAYQFSRSF
jgi:hypothetical protein